MTDLSPSRCAYLVQASVVMLALALPTMVRADVLAGRRIAAANCSPCHAIGRTGASPNPKSPPFRTLAQRYPLEDLEEALAEGILVGHQGPEMPQFQFSPQKIEDLLAYIRSISKK